MRAEIRRPIPAAISGRPVDVDGREVELHDPSSTSPSRRRLDTGLWLLCGWVISVLAGQWVTRGLGPGRGAVPFLIGTGAYQILFLLIAVALRPAVSEPPHPSDRDWQRTVLLGAFLLVIGNVSAAAVASMLAYLHPFPVPASRLGNVVKASVTAGPMATQLLIVDIVLLGPLAEEMVFRGVLLPWLAQWIGNNGALVLSSGLFGVAHIDRGYMALASTASGLVFGWARLRTGSIKPSAFLHVMWNCLLMLGVLKLVDIGMAP